MAKKRSQHTPQLFAVLGLGRFGSSVALTLARMGHEVIAVDVSEEKVQAVASVVTHAAQADTTDEVAMRALGMRNVDVAVVSIGDLEASVLTTLVLRSQGVKSIVAKAVSDAHGRVLDKVGADKVVYPERDMGFRVAHNLVSGNFIDYLELVPGYSIVELMAPASFFSRTLRQLDLRARLGVSIIAIRRGEDIEVGPGADDKIQEGDILVAMGRDDMLDSIENGVR